MEESNFTKRFNKVTLWYHGTTSTQVSSLKKGINVYHSKRNCDFGIGFYVTSKPDQAIKWASRKTRDERPFNPKVGPVVLSYQIQELSVIETKIFEIDKEYFRFVYQNRLKLNVKRGTNIHTFLAVFGPVLDGQITLSQEVLEDYFEEVISLKDVVDILLGKYQDDTQLCICDQGIADRLILVKEEVI
ncbi:DUF3990 domain-containing protein [Streptococcus danieliae]|uniref:DUF3990 domain-containing protein n=1 Tax=Streptococcus danieliae TaxID=747656 RepID=A0A7Z0S676_9STRE|nr:DUF3990 domain-containing protein [Streptococcus danieliae]MBF0699279.1 DUF3990 domain-containing protein [Streptococcus danieliae]NYS96455.1 DUF3990 domain-containing protein [Streptococcus danieliae]